ncbi:unnamed protein product [Nyctereutes procyonoides]|uniref:(raccoon dog) hypothetical protein n=1 Tax=Nyctereutes procyonoides TaxID=34880 RepID=A0A811XVY3_NYCPR|nr:unnamed protein product [Nyctereutes procyonoides]
MAERPCSKSRSDHLIVPIRLLLGWPHNPWASLRGHSHLWLEVYL